MMITPPPRHCEPVVEACPSVIANDPTFWNGVSAQACPWGKQSPAPREAAGWGAMTPRVRLAPCCGVVSGFARSNGKRNRDAKPCLSAGALVRSSSARPTPATGRNLAPRAGFARPEAATARSGPASHRTRHHHHPEEGRSPLLKLLSSCENAPFHALLRHCEDPSFRKGPKQSLEAERLLRPLQNDGGLAMTVGFPSVTECETSSKGDLFQC
jgi:hypothetical protein